MPKLKNSSANSKLKYMAFILMIGSFAFTSVPQAQTTPETAIAIPLGSVVRVTWIAPPDTDVVKYNLYLTGTHGEQLVPITHWYLSNTIQDSCSYSMTLSMPVGPGVADLTAVDRVGNESAHSNKVYYIVTDPIPGPPLLFQLKIVR
jgi:hypothetical protein